MKLPQPQPKERTMRKLDRTEILALVVAVAIFAASVVVAVAILF